jgi:Ni/Fe-hydrogenase b-type cytochrome subunit
MSAFEAHSPHLYYRHTLPVRIMHWINVIAVFCLLMSGLQIFNAHPALYAGRSSYDGQPPLLQMTAKETNDGEVIGVTRVMGHEFVTTGVLGASIGPDGEWMARGFPAWATIPDNQWLAMGRRWHLFFAWVFVINGLAYVVYSAGGRHLSRDLVPTGRDWRSIGQSIKEHLLFRHPRGEAEKHYNVLQKLTYLLIIFVVLPLIIMTGWAMSPGLNAVIPGWVDWFGGRQGGRTIHFLLAWALVAFVLVHVFEVIISGLWNHLRSMITGYYRLHGKEGRHESE